MPRTLRSKLMMRKNAVKFNRDESINEWRKTSSAILSPPYSSKFFIMTPELDNGDGNYFRK